MKKNLLSKLILYGLSMSTIAGFFVGNQAFAVASHDCGVTLRVVPEFSSIYSQDTIDTAIRNLDAYCCKKELNKETLDAAKRCENPPPPTASPASPFLFDHLVDVGLRRLDVLDAYTTDVDKTGKERRDKIQKISESEIILPETIIDPYKGYWTLNTNNYLGKKNLKVDNFDTEEQSTLERFNNNYNNTGEVSLADKYNNICLIARNLYEKSSGSEKISIGTNKRSNKKNYYNDCKNLVKTRVNQEDLYIRSLLVSQPNRILDNNLNKVLNLSFIQDRLMKFQDIILEIKSLFTTLVKQAAVCKKCTQ